MSTKANGQLSVSQLLSAVDAVETDDQSLRIFLLRSVAAIAPEDVGQHSSKRWIDIFTLAYGHLRDRGNKPSAVVITPIDASDPRSALSVDIFTADMPFLVDSVLGAIRALGGTVKSFAHPVLTMVDADGQAKLVEKSGPETRKESYLHVEIEPLPTRELAEALTAEIDDVLTQVRRAVRGWRPMLERLRNLVSTYRQNPPDVPTTALAEALHFLAWLADHNFTFLGMREYRLVGQGGDAALEPVEGSGLGILEDANLLFLRDGETYVEMTDQHVLFLQTSSPLMVTKANIRSKVHRRGHMDYIGVKLYGDDGKLAGELRVLGLFTSMSLTTPHSDVPLIRRKISDVMRRSGLDPQSHDGKALMAALDNYPREELFQISESDLFEFANIIAALPDRPKVRVLPRIDRFDNYVSILLFIPRDHYQSDLRRRIGEYLALQYDGRVSAYYPHFPEGELVRVHFIIGRNGGVTPQPKRTDLETEITRMTRSFGELLLESGDAPELVADYLTAFSSGYQSTHTEKDALADIKAAAALKDEGDIATVLARGANGDGLVLKVYHLGQPVPLSNRVPLLENFGFRVIEERSYALTRTSGLVVYLNEMQVAYAADPTLDPDKVAARVDAAISAYWHNESESDGLNQLVISAGLDWPEVVLVRAWSRYLRQIGTTFSQDYIAQVLNANAGITRNLVDLFGCLHDPRFDGNRDETAQSIRAAIMAALEKISSLDEDRILRHVLNLVDCALRTNFFQRVSGGRRPALAIKYEAPKIEGLPRPRPYREIHVYSPRVEGIHLRGGPIARGGLRWSDRPEDFRTEILGLVKAQMTKNSVIVPVGAKGGFVPKQMPANPDRDTFIAEGTACYKIFVNTLLDVTDNLDGDKVLPPDNVVRRDGDDPYLVVAADKGTATFSDTANAISQSRNFWLDDAFASGGSAGYDHKKMGITARGAWEAVKRHFRELDRDIQTSSFTTVGVGDMSGDVFGNGMLLSKQTRLIAAFDHRDIFIDPDPDIDASFRERRRLFEMGRSSWQDYDVSLISKGGGIFPRSSKSIALSHEIKQALGLTSDTMTPAQLMTAILKAKVDLLWFGGIGTYIRASSETNSDVGDRANDAIRITGKQIGAKVVGEGANLGATQLGRIEFAEAGGRINTDAIDNSAGVNSSDLEVNIKIALGTLVRQGSLSLEDRNAFLVEMTDEVANLCLRNNYLQTLSLSLTERRGLDAMPETMGLMQSLESRGLLDRGVEYLPDDLALHERILAHRGMTRPELAVLLAYAKNSLFDELLNSHVPDDPYLGTELYRYFPDQLAAKYPETIDNHRLRREVIATVLSNAMINRGGLAFISKLSGATSADAAQIAFAYAAARDSFKLTDLNAAVDALDNKVTGDVQLALYREIQTIMVNQTLWFLRNVSFEEGLAPVVLSYASGIDEIRGEIADLVTPYIAKSIGDQAESFVEGGAPRDLARRIAELSALTLSSDIVYVARKKEMSVLDVAKAYFAILQQFRLGRITELSLFLTLPDQYDRMALDRALANLMRAQRDIVEDVLDCTDGEIEGRVARWNDNLKSEISRIGKMVTDLTEGDLTVSRLSVAAGLLSDLARH